MSVTARTGEAGRVGRPRKRDREKTRGDILDVAFTEFAENGLSGSSIDAIAAGAHVSKTLIFYYFKSKEELFGAVLDAAYRRVRDAEGALRLDTLEPEDAVRRFAEFTFDYDTDNPTFVRLVLVENIHRGRHMAISPPARSQTRTLVDEIGRVLDRGVRAGAVRPGIDPVEFHLTLTALCFFYVSNRHTFGALFDLDMVSGPARARRRAEVADIMWRHVRAG